jgi:MFS superfamily sulfate permease-like transporter
VALGVLLAVEAYRLLSAGWALGIAAIAIILTLRENRYAPAAVVLVAFGLAMVFVEGKFAGISPPGFSLPPVTTFTLEEVWDSLLLAGVAQIPLTVTNATIATAALIRSYWPDRPVTEKRLSWNQGIMNLAVPFLGGMPMCHGAGGLAGQYYFGARTGGANILEGVIEITLGLFLAASIAGLFSVFPAPIVGAMMLMVGIEMTKFARHIRPGRDLFALGATVAVSILTNMAWGFIAGIAVHHLVNRLSGTED